MYAKVALLSPPYSTLTYKLPAYLGGGLCKGGMRVAVPLGTKNKPSLRVAIITEIQEHSPLEGQLAFREILWPLEKYPSLTADLLCLVADLSLRQSLTPGHVLSKILPQSLKAPSQKMLHRRAGAWLRLSLQDIRDASDAERSKYAEEILSGDFEFLLLNESEKKEHIIELLCEPPWPLRSAACRQIEVLDFLYREGSCRRSVLARRLGRSSTAAIDSLEKKGLIGIVRKDAMEERAESPDNAVASLPAVPFSLNAEQQEALDCLEKTLHCKKSSAVLLFGVTGSGKTAVYLHLARKCLENGRSMLILAPEVALAYKIRNEAEQYIPGEKLFFHHGYQAARRKLANFVTLSNIKTSAVVIGTRSALFLPLANLGCIVMDEEHDASYKQDEGMPFQSKEVAWSRMRHSSGMLLLGSATPDIKTFYAVKSGRLPAIRLNGRIASSHIAPVEFVPLQAKGRNDKKNAYADMLSEDSERALRDTIARGEQAVVLLNRRGYAQLVYCLDCRAIQKCPQCQIGLSYHKELGRLVCHYCDFTRPFPAPCHNCGSVNFLPFGDGTERLAERLRNIAGQPILRLDRDSTRRSGSMEEILSAFAAGKSPILVGTQMISKGHHFPDVTLALVADGDVGLNMPDYRATERTFQLLVQSAGRAGRGEKPGRVIIQTRDMSHYCWQYVKNRDYEGFFLEELSRRRKYNYPPFVCLALMRISFDMRQLNFMQSINELENGLRKISNGLGVTLLGPAPAPLSVLRGRRRYQCVLKADSWPPIRQFYFRSLELKIIAPCRITLDLDPVNML